MSINIEKFDQLLQSYYLSRESNVFPCQLHITFISSENKPTTKKYRLTAEQAALATFELSGEGLSNSFILLPAAEQLLLINPHLMLGAEILDVQADAMSLPVEKNLNPDKSAPQSATIFLSNKLNEQASCELHLSENEDLDCEEEDFFDLEVSFKELRRYSGRFELLRIDVPAGDRAIMHEYFLNPERIALFELTPNDVFDAYFSALFQGSKNILEYIARNKQSKR